MCWGFRDTPIATMRCMISYGLGTSLGVSEPRPPMLVKRHSVEWSCLKVKCTCVHFSSIVANYKHSLRARLYNRRLKVNLGLMSDVKLGPCNCGTRRSHVNKKKRLLFDVYSEEFRPTEMEMLAPNIYLKNLPVLAVLLSIFVGVLPAYANLEPPGQAGIPFEEEVISSGLPSVESILAKQLARRFREMSDEELVDILQQLLEASRSSGSATENSFGKQRSSPENSVSKQRSEQNSERVVGDAAGERVIENVRVPKSTPAGNRSENKIGKRIKSSASSVGVDKNRSDKVKTLETGDLLVDSDTVKTIDDDMNNPATEEETDQVGREGEEIIADERMQQTSGVDDAAFIVSPSGARASLGQKRFTSLSTPDDGDSLGIRSGDTYSKNESDVSGSIEATILMEPSHRKPVSDAEWTGKGEDLTGRLWAEWGRRGLENQDMGEADGSSSSTTPNVADLWQEVQSFSMVAIMKVVALMGSVFGRCESVGVVIIRILLFVMAFYLGRLHASSRKDLVNTKTASEEDAETRIFSLVSRDKIAGIGLAEGSASVSKDLPASWEAGLSSRYGSKFNRVLDSGNGEEAPKVGEMTRGRASGMENNLPETVKWWRMESQDGISPDTREFQARSSPSIVRINELLPSYKTGLDAGNREETGPVLTEGEPSSVKFDRQNEKWWKMESRERALPDIEETIARSAPSISRLKGSNLSNYQKILDAERISDSEKEDDGICNLSTNGEQGDKPNQHQTGKLLSQSTERGLAVEEDVSVKIPPSVPGSKDFIPKDKRLWDTGGGQKYHVTPAEGDSGINNNQLEGGKMFKKESTDGSRVQEVNHSRDGLRFSTRKLTSPMHQSHSDKGIGSEIERSRYLKGDGEETFVGSDSHSYQPVAPVIISPYIRSTELRALGSQPDVVSQHQGQVTRVNAKPQGAGGRDSMIGKGEFKTSDQKYVPTVLQKVSNNASNDINLDQIRVKSPAQVVQTIISPEIQVTSVPRIPATYHRDAVDLWATTAAVSVSKKFNSCLEVSGRETDGNPFSRKPDDGGANNGSWKEAEGETGDHSKFKLDSFLHGGILWVRDKDGVFLQQPYSKEERISSNLASFSEDVHDLSLRSRSTTGYLEGNNWSPQMSGKTVMEGSVNGFDYRKLFISCKVKSPLDKYDLRTFSTFVNKGQTTAAHAADLMRPLRYGLSTETLRYGLQIEEISQ